jgi:hypothetical protein
MSNAPRALVLDLLEWLANGPKPYAEVMSAWRTSCPRLTVWEDALDQGLVRRCTRRPSASVELTERGCALLAADRSGPLSSA